MTILASVLNRHWWTPLLTTVFLGAVLFFLLPSLALVALNSRSAMLGLIALGCAGFPWLIGRLHQISPLSLVLSFYLILAAGWFFQPASFDGNFKLALATYLIPWMITALLANTAVGSFRLRQRLLGERQ